MADRHPLAGRRRGQGRPKGGPFAAPTQTTDSDVVRRLEAALRAQVDELRDQLRTHWFRVIDTAVPGVDPALADAFACDAADLSLRDAELAANDDGTTTINVDAKLTDEHARMIGNVERDHHWTTTTGLPSRYVRRSTPLLRPWWGSLLGSP